METWSEFQGNATSSTWDLLSETFARLSALSHEARDQELAALDPEIRRRVETLLQGQKIEEQGSTLLDGPLFSTSERRSSTFVPVGPGSVVGAYRVLQEIARGGMGRVISG